MEEKQTVLVVDDAPENLTVISSILKELYHVKVATSGAKALSILASVRQLPDLILLDILMPAMDGYEVCTRIKNSEHAAIPIIFLTSLTNAEDEEKGLKLGAVDYIYKPIRPAVLLARVDAHLKLKQARDFLKVQNTILEKMVKQRTLELAQSQQATIVAMGALAEYRDPETGNHLRRTQHYVKCLAEELSHLPDYAEYLTVERIDTLFRSAPLHDIGKVGVPDSILFKPGRLNPPEFATMKGHALFGRNAIHETQAQMESRNSILAMAEQIAEFHHERWDGSGYPHGLAGADIPLSARLMAVADVYDALVSHRVYKPPFSHQEAIRIIREDSGKHFDPEIIEVFLKVADQFALIQQTFADTQVASSRPGEVGADWPVDRSHGS